MAVLHHAFRCAVTPEFDRDISEFFAAWQAGDRPRLSALALDGYARLTKREDLHAAFYLYPEGSASSWMQTAFVSPGLAALAMLAHRFVPIPGLSASRIYYFGQSFGGIYGTQLLGVDPLVRAGVPNVAGGSIVEVARLGSFRPLAHSGGSSPKTRFHITVAARVVATVESAPMPSVIGPSSPAKSRFWSTTWGKSI